MISRSIKVTYGFEPPRSGAASPSSVRNPYLTFLSSRIHLRFKPFGALAALFRGGATPQIGPSRPKEERRTFLNTLLGSHHRIDATGGLGYMPENQKPSSDNNYSTIRLVYDAGFILYTHSEAPEQPNQRNLA